MRIAHRFGREKKQERKKNKDFGGKRLLYKDKDGPEWYKEQRSLRNRVYHH